MQNLAAAVPLTASMDVLDFGAGYGFVAELLAPRVGALWVWDSSPTVRNHARPRIRRLANVRELDLGGTGPLPAVRFDLIVVNSVVQYMTPAEVDACVGLLAALLKPAGRLLVSDVIPFRHASFAEVFGLLRSAHRRHLRDLRVGAWRYLRARRALGLLQLGRDDLERLAHAHGLAVEILPRNLTHLETRLTAVFRPARADRG